MSDFQPSKRPETRSGARRSLKTITKIIFAISMRKRVLGGGVGKISQKRQFLPKPSFPTQRKVAKKQISKPELPKISQNSAQIWNFHRFHEKGVWPPTRAKPVTKTTTVPVNPPKPAQRPKKTLPTSQSPKRRPKLPLFAHVTRVRAG